LATRSATEGGGLEGADGEGGGIGFEGAGGGGGGGEGGAELSGGELDTVWTVEGSHLKNLAFSEIRKYYSLGVDFNLLKILKRDLFPLDQISPRTVRSGW